jgi:hypothetical protein
VADMPRSLMAEAYHHGDEVQHLYLADAYVS